MFKEQGIRIICCSIYAKIRLLLIVERPIHAYRTMNVSLKQV